MKKLFILLGILIGINCYGQFGKTVQLMGEVTINGNETALLKSDRMAQSNGFIGIQVVIDTVAITSGTGYAIAKASLVDFDSSYAWATLLTTESVVHTATNDTLIANANGSNLWGISVFSYDYVGVFVQGAVGDTFNVAAYYVGKEF